MNDKLAQQTSQPEHNDPAPFQINPTWKAHAYPLKLLTVHIQGTRRTEVELLARELERVAERLRNGDFRGESHDDDYGHRFVLETDKDESIFEGGCGGY
jgi:hypothetical protein